MAQRFEKTFVQRWPLSVAATPQREIVVETLPVFGRIGIDRHATHGVLDAAAQLTGGVFHSNSRRARARTRAPREERCV